MIDQETIKLIKKGIYRDFLDAIGWALYSGKDSNKLFETKFIEFFVNREICEFEYDVIQVCIEFLHEHQEQINNIIIAWNQVNKTQEPLIGTTNC
jgi:hypothetical protein